LRLSDEKASEVISSLVKAGLLDRKSNVYQPHNWSKRQYKSDVSTERVRAFRKRFGNVAPSEGVTVSETPSDTDSDSDTEQIQNRGEGKGIPPRVGKTAAPAEMEVSTEDWDWASREHLVGVDLEAETRAMIDWAHGKGEKRLDWLATRRNWWRNAFKRNGNGNGKSGAIQAFPGRELTPEQAAVLDEEIKELRATMS
jgi:hypothetical protein